VCAIAVRGLSVSGKAAKLLRALPLLPDRKHDEAKQTMAQTQLAAWLQTGIAERKENDRHTAEWSEMLTPLKVPKRAKRRPPGAGRDRIRRAGGYGTLAWDAAKEDAAAPMDEDSA
jgi:hypothetical protein